jgi:hypothetical protein
MPAKAGTHVFAAPINRPQAPGAGKDAGTNARAMYWIRLYFGFDPNPWIANPIQLAVIGR